MKHLKSVGDEPERWPHKNYLMGETFEKPTLRHELQNRIIYNARWALISGVNPKTKFIHIMLCLTLAWISATLVIESGWQSATLVIESDRTHVSTVELDLITVCHKKRGKKLFKVEEIVGMYLSQRK